MSDLSQFTNKYQISKTLRFELIPQGKTLENIKEKGLISQDEDRAVRYKKMKETIDEFHKYFIDLSLEKSELTIENLEDYERMYNATSEEKKEDKLKGEFKKIQEKLRKEIVASYTHSDVKDIYSNLFNKELITVELEKWKKEHGSERTYFDESFKKFTTYFSGFHQNRKNMYSAEEKSTAIAHRIINENLPKFIDNIKTFKYINGKFQDFFEDLSDDLLGGNSLEEIFSLKYYHKCLTQGGIDFFNHIIGGVTTKDQKKIQGLNEYINLYNQKQKDNKKRFPKFKPLFKQILSDRIRMSFLPESFSSDNEVLEAIYNYYECNLTAYADSENEPTISILEDLKNIISKLHDYDTSKIYLKMDNNVSAISKKLLGDYSIITTALNVYYDYKHPNFAAKLLKAYGNETKQSSLNKQKYTGQQYLSLDLIEEALDYYTSGLDKDLDVYKRYKKTSIIDYFKDYFNTSIVKKDGSEKVFDLNCNIKEKYNCIKGKLKEDFPEGKSLIQEKKIVGDIKLFLDAIQELMWFVKPLYLTEGNTLEIDTRFYEEFEKLFDQLCLITPLYNKVRNYMVKKPYSTNKIKLNFENSSFLSGWTSTSGYETKSGVIIMKEGIYYLAIINKKFSEEEIRKLRLDAEKDLAKRIDVKFQSSACKEMPRLFIHSKAVEKYNLPVQTIMDIYKEKKFKTEYRKVSPSDYRESLIKLIDYFKLGLEKHDSYKHYSLKLKSSEEYNDISEFYNDVDNSCYTIIEEDINYTTLNNFVNEGKVYLFKIYNKDFSNYSKGKPNLHTMYWKALFSEENLKDVVYKLNGQAEMFYRKGTIAKDKMTTHLCNNTINNKNPLNPKKQSIFSYDLIKDKRYTVDKFQFHVPITLNFKSNGSSNINQSVLEYLQNNNDVKIIGLDRGERHLIYLSLIDQNGRIIKQETLNIIKDEHFNIETNYHSLLDRTEYKRDKARKEWDIIENIKELKEGYLSQVVHKIATLMVERQAIVVMEDLNFGFKRGRFKVEKQIYQKLEKMLIDKLNYLVFKDKESFQVGGLFKALQLTNKFESFQKMENQSGFLFYVPAWNTSKIDPTTGFVNLLYPKYENKEKSVLFFDKFEDIRFNKEKNYFEFKIDYSKFTDRATGSRTYWTVCSFGERIVNFRDIQNNNKCPSKTVVLTEEFISLFNKFDINYESDNLKEQIRIKNDKKFYEGLLNLMKLTLQMRNSNKEIDYLISPVAGNDGIFFDSRNADESLPKDADANGAYHIAKKGLWILDQLRESKDLKKVKLAISNKEWLSYVQSAHK